MKLNILVSSFSWYKIKIDWRKNWSIFTSVTTYPHIRNRFDRLPQFLNWEIIWVCLYFSASIYLYMYWLPQLPHFNRYTWSEHRPLNLIRFNHRISIDPFNGSIQVCFRFYRLTHVYSHHSFIVRPKWIGAEHAVQSSEVKLTKIFSLFFCNSVIQYKFV